MPIVMISYREDLSERLPRDFVRRLAEMLPHSIAESTGGEPEEVRVDATPFSPFAQNQPLISVHISIKAKGFRDDGWLRRVIENEVIPEILHFLKSLAPNFDASDKGNDIHVIADLVPRKWDSLSRWLKSSL